MFFLFVTADTDLVRAQTICGGDTHVSPIDRTKRMKTNGAQQAGAASRYPALARDSGYLPWYVNSTKGLRERGPGSGGSELEGVWVARDHVCCKRVLQIRVFSARADLGRCA